MRPFKRFTTDPNQFGHHVNIVKKCLIAFQTDFAKTSMQFESIWNQFAGYKSSCELSGDFE